MVRELARVADAKVSRRAELGVKTRRKRAAVAAILAARVKLVRRSWWRLRMQEVRAGLSQWLTVAPQGGGKWRAGACCTGAADENNRLEVWDYCEERDIQG
jgi:hypothetical protein